MLFRSNADLESTANGIYTEDKWNTSSSLEHQPYSYSKTVAEKEAWKVAKLQWRWDLVVVNPSLVIGPGINANATSESFNLIKQFGDGRMKTGIPSIALGVVDVRDLAQAHLRAAFTPSAKGRHIVSAHNTTFPEMAQSLLPKYSAYPVPRRVLPKWLVWLVGPLADKSLTRKMISLNVGYPFKADNIKSVRELKLSYRPMNVSMEDMFQQMIDSGQFKKR